MKAHPVDHLVGNLKRAEAALVRWADTAPQIAADQRLDEDGELVEVLVCRRCTEDIGPGQLVAVGVGWTSEYGYDFDFEAGTINFGEAQRPDVSVLYYTHGDNPGHAVSLPSGWTEEWL